MKIDPITMIIGTLNQMVTVMKSFWLKFKVFYPRWRTDGILDNIVFGHNSAADCLIFVKIYKTMQNPRVMTEECENVQTLKIQDVEQHLENRYIAIFQWNIVRFWWNFVRWSRLGQWMKSCYQNLSFFTSTWQADAILENVVLSHWIVQFSQNFVWSH